MSLIATYYSSADAGAPALSGQAGSLATLLDALLVDGYGTGPSAKPGLGWTREFSATNKRVFRNNPVSGSGYSLRLDDSNAQYGLLRGYQSMSGIDTGTNPLPTEAQMANGSLWPKSNSASSAVRTWWAIGTEKQFYLFLDPIGGTIDMIPHFAGDIIDWVPGGQHNFCISNNNLTTYSANLGNCFLFTPYSEGWESVPAANNAALYCARNHLGEVGAVRLGASGVLGRRGSVWGHDAGSTARDVPEQVNGGLMYQRGLMVEAIMLPRGEMPGLVVPFLEDGFADLEIVSDLDGLPPGTQLIAKRFRPGSTINRGSVLFDLTNEW